MDAFLLYEIFRFSYFAVFVGLHLALMAGVVLEWLRDRKDLKNLNTAYPKISVIIPVHNESLRIQRLLESLAAQDYPQAEIIFVDDRSHDHTADMIAAFIKKMPRAMMITLKENPGPNYKQYALARGIEASSGELLLFTDADCEMAPCWMKAMARRMADTKTGVAIGPVLKRANGKSFFDLYQCFEHGIRYIYLAGATGLGAAGGGFGNNLILRRASLQAIGGYENIPPSPTEDAALISKIRSCSEYKIRSAVGADAQVITCGERSWKDLVNQTLRWNNGGLFSPDGVTRFNYAFLMLAISMGILAVPLLPFIPSIWPLPLGVLISMTFNTIANLGLFSASLPQRRLAYVLALIFTPAYFTFLTAIGLAGVKPTWKGKTV
ncbi:MAG: glycosyltransferase [Treponema sp.]|nr:glycosyltransferase [Treponema sp.]